MSTSDALDIISSVLSNICRPSMSDTYSIVADAFGYALAELLSATGNCTHLNGGDISTTYLIEQNCRMRNSGLQGADECDSCKHAKDGPYCQSECPMGKYLNQNEKTCHPCHVNCLNNCTGPSSTECTRCREMTIRIITPGETAEEEPIETVCILLLTQYSIFCLHMLLLK